LSYGVEMLQEVSPPPDAADMLRWFCKGDQCRAEMRREDLTVRRYVITSLCAMAAGNHTVPFNVNVRRNITPTTNFEIFVEGEYVQVEGLLSGAVSDAPELRVVRLRPPSRRCRLRRVPGVRRAQDGHRKDGGRRYRPARLPCMPPHRKAVTVRRPPPSLTRAATKSQPRELRPQSS
jgi:hypothetical protein